MYRLTYERVRRHIPIYKLAHQACVDRNALSLIERGRVVPTADELAQLARVLDIPASELMKRVVLPEAEPTTAAVVR